MMPTLLILAGGRGERLRAAVADRPKPLAEVAGRPFLEYLVAQSRGWKCTDIVLCVGHQADQVMSHFGDGSAFGVSIRYSVEKELLGTAGALRLARDLIRTDSFLVFNGDSYCDADLDALISHHRGWGAQATLVVSRVEDRTAFGSVEVGEGSRVRGFLEKGSGQGSGWVNAGIYLLERLLLNAVPADRACSIEREIFPTLIATGLYAFPCAVPFLDIGTPESLAAAQSLLPQRVNHREK